jgi:hypothetical protein
MKKTIFAAASLTCLALLPTATLADKFDMAELTYKQFLAEKDGIMPTIFWIDGYLSKETGNTVMDFDQMAHNVEIVSKGCEGAPNKKIFDFFKP